MGVWVKDEVKKIYKYALKWCVTVSFPRRLSPLGLVNPARLWSLGEAKEGGKCTKQWVGGRVEGIQDMSCGGPSWPVVLPSMLTK